MRRREFEITDRDEAVAVLERADWGTLGLVDADASPVLVPLNHVHVDGRLYFHGAPAGEKITVLAENDRASFLVVEQLARVPSYFLDEARACGATQFFRSVIAKGRVRLVPEPREKAAALGALMRKLQPEGRYVPLDDTSPLYQAALQGIAVIALEIETLTAKFKAGQNMSAAKLERVRAGLEARGSALDRATLDAMATAPPRAASGLDGPERSDGNAGR